MTAPPPPPPKNPLVPTGGTGFDLQASIFNQLLRVQTEVIVPGRGTSRLYLGLTEAAVRAHLGEPEEIYSLDELLDDDEEFFGLDHHYRRQGVSVTYKGGRVFELMFLSGVPGAYRTGGPRNPYPGVIEPDLPLTSDRAAIEAVYGAPAREPDGRFPTGYLWYPGISFEIVLATDTLVSATVRALEAASSA